MTQTAFAIKLTAITLLLAAGQLLAQFTDPANLRGERVKPRDGRELPIDQGARGLEQMLRRLNTRASLMLIVAHPDDEDGGMLTYYSRGLGARVAVLTLTRGEGGQNAMTGDFEDALGLLRTQELLSADRYLGVDQFFGTEVDFGFSKTKEEAFKKWTHERVLYDAVRSIRLYRPLVIAAVFIGGVTDGHGQHQVSGQIAQEAYKAAADPTVFPDMIAEGILPWQALKVYARVPSYSISDKGLFDYATGKYTAPRFENYVTGEVTTTMPYSDVIVHEGTPDSILSDDPSGPLRTYVQFARIGLGMQKSQIGGNIRVPPAGAFDVAYHLYGSTLCTSTKKQKGCRPERIAERGVKGPAALPATAHPLDPSSSSSQSASFFDGIDMSIEGIADLAPGAKGTMAVVLKNNLQGISHSISEAQLDLKPKHPELAAKRLAEALTLTDLAISNTESFRPEWLPADQKANVLHELRVKRVQLNDALVLALSLSYDAFAPTQTVVAGLPISIGTSLSTQGPADVTLQEEVLHNAAGKESASAPAEQPAEALVAGKPITRTLGLGPQDTRIISRPYFHRDGLEQPFYRLNYSQLRNAPSSPPSLTAWAKIEYQSTNVVVGRIVHTAEQAARIVPALNVALSNHDQVLANDQSEFILSMIVSPHLDTVHQQVDGPEGWVIEPLSSTSPGITKYKVSLPEGKRQSQTMSASASLPGGLDYDEGYRSIGYGDLPRTSYYEPASTHIVPVDLNLPPDARIAYLAGTGDAVAEALASINLKPDILTVADLTPAKLAQYDTVILGVRTYAAHPNLHGTPTQSLIDFTRSGGNVLVQYQTYEFSGSDAPYPLALGSNERVVDETAPVRLLDSVAPLLTIPNRITPADFNNWVEERGHGFLESWDPRYTALTETHDPDQDPQRGGLVTTPLGKGRWTYCAFALYRQLPEAVPGAFRLFVNLLSLTLPAH